MEIIKPYITENIKKYGEQSILESLGSFPKQRQMSDKITEKLFDKVYGIHQDTFFVGLEEFGDPNIKIAEITKKFPRNPTAFRRGMNWENYIF